MAAEGCEAFHGKAGIDMGVAQFICSLENFAVSDSDFNIATNSV